jgi:hypothetical protein
VYEQTSDFRLRKRETGATMHQNVILLHSRRGPSQDLPVPVERLGIAFRKLNDLWRCIERVICDPRSSALKWTVASAPLLPRLPGARESLADLDGVRVGRWPDTGWALRLRAACDEVEWRLSEVTKSIISFVGEEASNVDAEASFSFDCTKLAEAVGELCRLIASQYPEALSDI